MKNTKLLQNIVICATLLVGDYFLADAVINFKKADDESWQIMKTKIYLESQYAIDSLQSRNPSITYNKSDSNYYFNRYNLSKNNQEKKIIKK